MAEYRGRTYLRPNGEIVGVVQDNSRTWIAGTIKPNGSIKRLGANKVAPDDVWSTVEDALAAYADGKGWPVCCKVCGCTEDNACEGGCWWASDSLCSSCLGEATTCYDESDGSDESDESDEGETAAEAEQVSVRMLPVADIIPTPDNPRTIDVESASFQELVESVRGQGVLVPVCVRPHPEQPGKWDLRYGERRWQAAQAAGLECIPAIIRELDDQAAFELTFTENYGREDLSPLEEGRAVQTLLDRLDGDLRAVAAKLGRTERWVALRRELAANLADCWCAAAAQDDFPWGVGHLVLIARLPEVTQEVLIQRYGHRWNYVVNVSVAELEREIQANLLHVLAAAPWPLDDEGLADKQACVACPYRSGRQLELWEHDVDDDRCLNPDCWEAKRLAWLQRQAAEHPDAKPIMTSYSWHEQEQLEKLLGAKPQNQHYDEKLYKRQTKDMQPVLVVDGPDMGQIRYRKKPDRGASAEDEQQRKTVEQKRAKLEGKRWRLVIAWIEERGSEMLVSDLPAATQERLYELAVVFDSADALFRHWTDKWAEWQAGVDEDTIRRRLWERVRQDVAGDAYHAIRTGQLADEIDRTVIDGVCSILGLDADELYRQACEEKPEPKSWAKQEQKK